MDFYILDDGNQIFFVSFTNLALAESFFQDRLFNLGSFPSSDDRLTFGYDLVANGDGGFGIEFGLSGVLHAVPEPSTWAMMLIGFAGLGFATYRRKLAGTPVAA